MLGPRDRLELSNDPDIAWSILEPTQRFVNPAIEAGLSTAGRQRFVCISDTHAKHRGCKVGAVLILHLSVRVRSS